MSASFRVTRLAGILTAAVILAPPPARAQHFEGIVRIRLVEVDVDRAERLKNIRVPDLLDLATDELLQLKGRNGSPAVSTSLRTYLVKDRRIRMEADEGDESSFTLINLEDKTIRIVSPANETYYEISIPELTRPLFPMLQTGGYTVRPLGQEKKVNGMSTTGYEAVAGNNLVRAWLTQEHPALTELLEALTRAVSMPTTTAEDRLMGLAQLGAPVLVQLVDMDGEKLDDYEVQEIIAIQAQALDSRLFQVPEGYTRVDH